MTHVFGKPVHHYALAVIPFALGIASAQTDYDLLLKGGHVIDGKNHLSALRDVAIQDGKIAAVEPSIAPSRSAMVMTQVGTSSFRQRVRHQSRRAEKSMSG